MSDYMASLDRLIARDDRLLLPGHGGPVKHPATFLRGLKDHRKMRERAIVERLRQGDRSIDDMVKAIYRDTDPKMHAAAALSVLAHLEDLVARDLCRPDGDPQSGGSSDRSKGSAGSSGWRRAGANFRRGSAGWPGSAGSTGVTTVR